MSDSSGIMPEADWKRFDALTDADIDAAIAGDPDWQGLDDIDWAEGFWIDPQKNSVTMQLQLDKPTYEWFVQHNVNLHHLFAHLVQRYRDTHS